MKQYDHDASPLKSSMLCTSFNCVCTLYFLFPAASRVFCISCTFLVLPTTLCFNNFSAGGDQHVFQHSHISMSLCMFHNLHIIDFDIWMSLFYFPLLKILYWGVLTDTKLTVYTQIQFGNWLIGWEHMVVLGGSTYGFMS